MGTVLAPGGVTCVRPDRGPRAFTRRTRSASFTPDQLSGLKLWLKADGTLWQDSGRTTPATADADPVGAWDDAGADGRHATQGTSGRRPLLKLSVLNSKPVVRFDGADDFLGFTGVGLTDWSAFFVVKQTGDNGLLGGTTTDGKPQMRVGQSGADKLSIFDGTNNPQSDALGVAQGSWSLLEFVRSGSTASFYQNGTAYNSGTCSGTLTFAQVAAFTDGAGNPAAPLSGDLAELVLYNAALSSADRQSVEQYLDAKYNLGF